MEMNGGFLVTKIKQLGDRIFEKLEQFQLGELKKTEFTY